MPLVNWGFLGKSQFDQELIEEAIARLITAHNDDETAHLEVGQSLQSHKASEIIDHLAASIVTDKLGDYQVTMDKTIDDRFSIRPTFESTDGWGKTLIGTGAVLNPNIGGCQILTGNASGNRSSIYAENAVLGVGNDKNPMLQCVLDISSDNAAIDVAVVLGQDYAFDLSDSIGFRWSKADTKMYCFYCYDGVEYKQQVVGFDYNTRNTLRIEVDSASDEIRYFVNGVLVLTASDVGSVLTGDVYFSITGKKNSGSAGTMEFWVYNIVYFQDW